jgi:hypothetical protein
MGTARMGTDPETSVVNEWGRAHDVKNLFIIDGSIFVTAAAVNPTNTIQALALYVADTMKKNLGQPLRLMDGFTDTELATLASVLDEIIPAEPGRAPARRGSRSAWRRTSTARSRSSPTCAPWFATGSRSSSRRPMRVTGAASRAVAERARRARCRAVVHVSR